jgi:hypothetical protein
VRWLVCHHFKVVADNKEQGVSSWLATGKGTPGISTSLACCLQRVQIGLSVAVTAGMSRMVAVRAFDLGPPSLDSCLPLFELK